MQEHDLSTMTPATRAVFDAVHYLGQGNVHELVEQSGKARSTVDKAIKALSDAGLIVAVDSDADPAEGVPTRWTMAEGIAESVTADDTDPDTGAQNGHGDAGTAGDFEPGRDDADTDADDLGDDSETDDNPADDNPQPGTDPDSGNSSGQDDTLNADDQDDDGETDHGPDDPDEDGDQDDTDDDSDDDDSDDDPNEDQERDEDEEPARGTARFTMQPSRPGDRKVMAIKGVLAEFGDDGATLDEIVAESGIGHPTASRLLTAMEQADAARRLPGRPGRWIPGPTKASDVDPNPQPPRCPICFQVVKGVTESPAAVAQILPLIRPDGTIHVVAEDGTTHMVTLPKRLPIRTVSAATAGAVRRTDLTVNGDGSQPFAKGELEKLTFETLKANPGRTMTPQEIASAISAQLAGRTVSSGAVRNNCGKLGAAGRIVMVSASPWAFKFPLPADDSGHDDQADDATEDIGDPTADADSASVEQS